MSIGNHRRLGHWEGDNVEGAKSSGGIATHVEKKSRVLVAAKLSDKSADTLLSGDNNYLKVIPEKWCKT
ncbi:hypothetical protein [Candidatus Vondammii sp. HM_W22]|uniref:hypothetical protein n=1 Tax=Candidatus Vondammii sp. HM_W22 TaxID=2687299 RepID=UPI001F145BB5|nr:hypothetical protein [Candidatus Vondammii sp. HM_W22]